MRKMTELWWCERIIVRKYLHKVPKQLGFISASFQILVAVVVEFLLQASFCDGNFFETWKCTFG